MNLDSLTPEKLIVALTGYVIVIVSLSFHEWGHAFAADKLGDDTPRRMGRVTINPLAHIDLVGTVIIPLFALLSGWMVVGWAKPVLINPDNLPKKSQRAWVTIAGPAMNLVLAIAAAVALRLTGIPLTDDPHFVARIMIINISLMMFNLLPVPPLDGSKFLMYWFGMSERTYVSFARFGWVALMAMFYIPFTRDLIWGIIGYSAVPFFWLAGWFQ